RLLEELREEPAGFTLDLVGEVTVSQLEAVRMLERYEALIADLAAATAGWPEIARIDRDDRGPVARVNVSVKPSSLYAPFDPLDAETELVVGKRLQRLFRLAAGVDAAISLEMEQRALKDRSQAIFRNGMDDE